MKKYLIPILLMFVVFSCKKDEDTVDLSLPASYMHCTVTVTPWEAANIEATITKNSTQIKGTTADGSIITISLSADSVGLYDASPGSAHALTYTPAGESIPYSSQGNIAVSMGQVLISDIDVAKNEVTGEFSFLGARGNAGDVLNIHSGRFVRLKYIGDANPSNPNNPGPSGSKPNSLKAKLNGVEWKPPTVKGFRAFERLHINAIGFDGISKMTFELPSLIAPGKYELNYFTKTVGYFTGSDHAKYFAINGTLEIVSHNLVNKEIEATFNMVADEFEGTRVNRFTEGTFFVKYD